MWKTAAIVPLSIAARMSAALRQILSAPARSSRNRMEAMPSIDTRASSIGSSDGSFSSLLGAEGTEPPAFSGEGEKMANMPPAKPPVRARGRSICQLAGAPSMNSFSLSGSGER